MRYVFTVALACALAAPASSAFAAGAATGTATVSGTARTAGAKAAKTTVRLRNLADGQLAGTTTTNAAGQFSFTGLDAGNYAVEIVNAAGKVIGTSSPITVAAGAAVSDVGVAMAGAAATGGAVGAPLVGIITLAGAGAAVAGVVVADTRPAASASR